jgi:hypothetical protein
METQRGLAFCGRTCAACELLSTMWNTSGHYFEGKTFAKSTVSSSGVAPEGTPFFCNRKAMMFTEFVAATEPGAIIGIWV